MLAIITLNACTNNYDTFATLQGTVTDNETSEPVANANVVLSPGSKNQLTDSNGNFEFKELEAIQYTATVQKSGYQTNRKTITLISGETTEMSITLNKN